VRRQLTRTELADVPSGPHTIDAAGADCSTMSLLSVAAKANF